jgi:hypothetical protein
VRLALSARIGPLDIGQATGTLTPDPVKDFVERTNFAGLDTLTSRNGCADAWSGDAAAPNKNKNNMGAK